MALLVFASLGTVTLSLSLSLSLAFDEGTEGIEDDNDSSVPTVSLHVVPSSGTEGNLDARLPLLDFRLLFFCLGNSPNHSPSSLFDGGEPKQSALQKEGQSVFWAVD
jgi:hypothetical protein